MSENATTELVWVDCPDCLNASRPGRRRCKAKGGMCKGLGVVEKWVPIRGEMTAPAPTPGAEIDYEALGKAWSDGQGNEPATWANVARAVVAALLTQGFRLVPRSCPRCGIHGEYGDDLCPACLALNAPRNAGKG